MALNALWISVLCFAHVAGISFLLYSVEQTFGCFGTLFGSKSKKVRKGDIEKTKRTGSVRATGGVLPTKVSEFRWRDVKCWSRGAEPKQILQNCFGVARSGETVAIMGPSGAGKSTLMELLYGQPADYRVEGRVLLDGRPITPTMMRRVASMVTQQDVFMPTLSVEETLVFRASLTMAIDPKDADSSIDSILSATGENHDEICTLSWSIHIRLCRWRNCAGLWQTRRTKVGGLLPGGIDVKGISGGEKRRLSIACALVSDPQILFLDEPTSGEISCRDAFRLLKSFRCESDGSSNTVAYRVGQLQRPQSDAARFRPRQDREDSVRQYPPAQDGDIHEDDQCDPTQRGQTDLLWPTRISYRLVRTVGLHILRRPSERVRLAAGHGVGRFRQDDPGRVSAGEAFGLRGRASGVFVFADPTMKLFYRRSLA